MSKELFCVNGIYSDGMVLQREVTNCATGSAEPFSSIQLSFRGKTFSAKSDADGKWSIEFNPGKAGGPFELSISNQNEKIEYKDVFVGEVWVSSGQSNAQLPMERLFYSYPEEFSLKKNDNIRMITMPISYAFDGPRDTVENPKWVCASPETMGSLSGTAYFFAKKLYSELKVPVGIINASQGGSPVESWMDYDSFKQLGKKDYLLRADKWKNSKLVEETAKKAADAIGKWYAKVEKEDKGIKNAWDKLDYLSLGSEWKDCVIPADFTDIKKAGVMWFKKEFELTAEELKAVQGKKVNLWLGTIVDADKAWVNGAFCGETPYCYPPRRYSIPTGALKEGKNTLTVRVQKNSSIPVRFYEEKPYFIFTDDVYIPPVAYRNVEKVPAKKLSEKPKGLRIDLSGNWKCSVGCEVELRPGEMFFEWEPTALYNTMLAPCLNHSVRGAIWYQGESNALRYSEYKELLCKMIELWRGKFKYAYKNMPFVVLQLPGWNDGRKNVQVPDAGSWPQLRKAQADAVYSTENAGLAVLIDGGEWNDLHPEKKLTAGTRAAQEALRLAYGKKYPASPKVLFCEKKNKVFTIRFDSEKSGLFAYEVTDERADFSKQTEKVYGFSFLAEKGKEKVVLDAEAKLISKNEVEIYEPVGAGIDSASLCELRYLWSDNPDIVNLYTKDEIPVGPFNISL
jgi:sialate O-acetylesterase